MTIVLELTPEQEARLHEKAKQQGKEVGSYLIDVALQDTRQDEWLRLISSMGVETGVSLTDEAVSRESWYEDHDRVTTVEGMAS